MASFRQVPLEPESEAFSLEELAAAYAQALGKESAAEEAGRPPTAEAVQTATPEAPTEVPSGDDPCPLNPLTILEAMLFVGSGESRPLTPFRAAEVMRDVSVDEIPQLIRELNRRYDARGSPYRIVGEGDGYRMVLREEFRPLHARFQRRLREARLSQAAIDVLALVAYRQPMSSEEVSRLRGKPSNHILAHLVRRGLLRIERPDPKRRTPCYYTTERFLRLFNLSSLDDLPRSEDFGPP